MTIYRFRAHLSGWDGGPGINTFYASPRPNILPTGAMIGNFGNQLRAMYVTLQGYLAHGVRVTFDTEVAEIEPSDASLIGISVLEGLDPVNSTAAQSTSLVDRAAMLNVKHQTDKIVGNRILAGRSFFGPVNNTVFDYEGQIQPQVADDVRTAYEGMLDIAGAIRLVTFSQPKEARLSASGKPLPAQEGTFGYVQSASCQPRPGTLRSRKV